MLEHQIHQKVANDLGIPLERVKAYDALYWKQLKIDLNNPTFDVMEVPFLGSFTITPAKLRTTLKFALRDLKRLRKKISTFEEIPPNLVKHFETDKQLFKDLWKLREVVKFDDKYRMKRKKK